MRHCDDYTVWYDANKDVQRHGYDYSDVDVDNTDGLQSDEYDDYGDTDGL